MNSPTLDDTNRAVLTVFHYEDQPLQERQVHEHLERCLDDLPIAEPVPLPEVERRIGTLHTNRYLERVITSPDPTAKELIAAYILAEKAERLF